MAQPLVSILTPSFNQATWLPHNLKSVANQSYPNIEHLVMDGGSADGSVELLRSAGPNVRWWSENDEGQSDALNKAFSRSSGEIIGWINSDDAYVDRRVVAWIVEEFARNPSIDIIYGDVLLVGSSNEVLQYFHMNYAGPFTPIHNSRKFMLRYNSPIMQPGAFFRRRLANPHFLDESFQFCMDTEFWLRSIFNNAKLKYIPKLIGIDRDQPDRKGRNIELLRRMEIEHELLRDRYGLAVGRDAHLYGSLARRIQRIAGLQRLLNIEHVTEPAFELRFDAAANRLRRQLLLPREAMLESLGGLRSIPVNPSELPPDDGAISKSP